ncbi:MAG: hypothetical protein ACOC0M_00080 [Halomonas sp.]
MDFNLDKFSSTHFNPREAEVPVPDLAPFFEGEPETDDDGNPIPPKWRVRGLTGAELGRCNEAQQRNRDRRAIAEGLLSGKDVKMTEAVRALVGEGDSVPDDVAKRLEMLVLGSVAPEITHSVAVRLAEAFPVEFYAITTKIVQLTGQGAEPGKPKRSSGKTTSGSRSTSAT